MRFKAIPVQTVYLEWHKYDQPVLRDLPRLDLMDVVLPNPALMLLPGVVLCVSRQLISRVLLAATHCPDAFVQQDIFFHLLTLNTRSLACRRNSQPLVEMAGGGASGGTAQHHQRLEGALCLSSEPTFIPAPQDFAGNSYLCFLQAR